MEKLKFLLLLFIPIIGYPQCEVLIEPGSVEVTDNGSGVKFEFDITNNSLTDWYGDVLKLNWSLNSSAPIWEIDYSTNVGVGIAPIAPGETRTIKTPWFDFPNLPPWFPSDPNASQPWEESLEWPYYGLSFPFEGAWSPFNLRLGSCTLGEGAWVYDSNGELYYGPSNSECPDVNSDALCDCDVNFTNFDPTTLDFSVEIISHWNCGQPLNGLDNTLSANIDAVGHLNFGIHVPGWDYQWGCTNGSNHLGWAWINWTSNNNPNLFLYSGDVFEANVTDFFNGGGCFAEILTSDTLTACTEVVLWQINYSQTLNITDGGWAVNPSGTNTQEYPDIDIELNTIEVCPAPVPLSPDVAPWPSSPFPSTTCIDGEPAALWNITVANYNTGPYNATDTAFVYCIEVPELGLDSCLNGNITGGSWIEPGGGQLIWSNVAVPDSITQFTINIYSIEDESISNTSNNSIVVQNIIQNPDICEISGCTNSSALNYNPEATIDDGSCEYFEGGCDLELIGFDTETFDLTIAVNNGYGCSNPNVDDYDPFNDDIYDLVIGIHSITESEPYSCFFNQNPNDPYYGWALLNFPIDLPLALYDIGQGSDGSLNTGDTITVNLAEASNFNTQESCLAEAFVNGYFDNCSQIVIWQINDSNGSDFWNGYFEASQWDGDEFPYPEYWDESVDCIPGDSDWSTICNNQLSFGPLCGGDPPPPIPEGCLDPDAYNYDPEAVLDDDSCEYVDLNYYQTTVYFDCDTTNVNQWTFTTQIKVSNIGDVAVDNWCVQGYIDGDVGNPFFDECYPITIEPGDIYTLYMPDVINPVDLGYELPLDNITYVVYGVEGENVLYNNDQTIPNELIQYFNCIETGCTDQLACNYNPEANAGVPEEECNYPDECGECDGENSGPGAIYDCGCDPLPFPESCDCEGNEPIDLFQCDCEGTPDLDQDGICDEEDDCVGYIDECGVCNGPGAIYDCGCFDIPDGDCDCLGNTLDGCGECGGDGVDIDGDGLCDDVDPCIGFYDDCGVCNGDNSTCYGCTDPEADNYNLTAWFDDGSCIYCSTDVWAPNAVTPNNDGVNDVWQVVTEYPDCWRIWETKIYNRWGQLVWYSEDITDKWVVNVQGGQYYVSDGVYIYVIRGETWGITNSIFHQTGHITVFR